MKSAFYMFYGDSSLKTIYVSGEWNLNLDASSYMFNSCTSLIGGSGTSFDEEHVDGAYARIDGGSSNPGYFTIKN